MRYAVFGPRDLRQKLYDNIEHVAGCLDYLSDLTGIIHGGGRGVEALVQQYAVNKGIEPYIIRPNHDAGGGTLSAMQAFDNRNLLIITEADAIVVFWDGQFTGMVPIMQRSMLLNKKVILYPML